MKEASGGCSQKRDRGLLETIQGLPVIHALYDDAKAGEKVGAVECPFADDGFHLLAQASRVELCAQALNAQILRRNTRGPSRA